MSLARQMFYPQSGSLGQGDGAPPWAGGRWVPYYTIGTGYHSSELVRIYFLKVPPR